MHRRMRSNFRSVGQKTNIMRFDLSCKNNLCAKIKKLSITFNGKWDALFERWIKGVSDEVINNLLKLYTFESVNYRVRKVEREKRTAIILIIAISRWICKKKDVFDGVIKKYHFVQRTPHLKRENIKNTKYLFFLAEEVCTFLLDRHTKELYTAKLYKNINELYKYI